MQRQRTLLADRYDLSDRPATGVMMSGGRKAVQQGVRVKLPAGVTWEQLAAMSPDEIRAKDLFPRGFLPLPHVKHETGGMVFPDFEIKEIDDQEMRSLQRFDVAFHLNPDNRPQAARFRIDTVSLRGVFNQQIHGSKRSLRSVEDFTEFEQRTAYFNGDEVHAAKKGMVILNRVQVSHMAQMQNMLDFPPAPKLNPATARLDRSKATQSEIRGEEIFFGKG